MKNRYYDEDVYAKPVRELRSVEFNKQLAAFLVRLGFSGEETVEWVPDETFYHHRGKLYGPHGHSIPKDRLDLEKEFPLSSRRQMNAYKARATGKHAQRLHWRCVPRVMFMDVARTIWCGRHGQDPDRDWVSMIRP